MITILCRMRDGVSWQVSPQAERCLSALHALHLPENPKFNWREILTRSAPTAWKSKIQLERNLQQPQNPNSNGEKSPVSAAAVVRHFCSSCSLKIKIQLESFLSNFSVCKNTFCLLWVFLPLYAFLALLALLPDGAAEFVSFVCVQNLSSFTFHRFGFASKASSLTSTDKVNIWTFLPWQKLLNCWSLEYFGQKSGWI